MYYIFIVAATHVAVIKYKCALSVTVSVGDRGGWRGGGPETKC